MAYGFQVRYLPALVYWPDGSGGRLAGVKVTLRNVDTGGARDTRTNESVDFFFPLVNPGRYEASVEKTGFKKGIQDVSVRTGIRSTADFTLQLGQVTDSVQVTGESPLLETSTSPVSRNVSQRTVQDMPLPARNVLMLINLAPGITNIAPTSNTTGLIDIDSVSYTSASGANNRTNEFLLDGIPSVDDVRGVHRLHQCAGCRIWPRRRHVRQRRWTHPGTHPAFDQTTLGISQ